MIWESVTVYLAMCMYIVYVGVTVVSARFLSPFCHAQSGEHLALIPS